MTKAKTLMAHGLRQGARRPTNPCSCAFPIITISFSCTAPFAANIRPREEEGGGVVAVVAVDEPALSTVASRESKGRQLAMPVPVPVPAPVPDRRFAENEGLRSALRRRSSLLADCAGDCESFVREVAHWLTRGTRIGGASSSSDEADERLLIPAGVVEEQRDRCPGSGAIGDWGSSFLSLGESSECEGSGDAAGAASRLS